MILLLGGFLCLPAGLLHAKAGAADPASRAAALDPHALILAHGLEPVPLDRHFQSLRDDGGRWTIDDIRSPSRVAQFMPAVEGTINHGFTQTTYWYRIRIHNPGDERDHSPDWVLELQYPMLDHVDIYIDKGATGTQAILTGDLRQRPPEQLSHRTFAIPLRIEPGQGATLYLRVQTGGSHQLIPVLWTDHGFHEKAERENLWHGAFYGIMLVMALYNLCIYIWIRDRAYLYYVLYIVAQACTSLTYGGHARQYGNELAAAAPAWINASVPLMLALMYVFGTLFGREFLQTRQWLPRVHRWLGILAALTALIALATPVIPVILSLQLSSLMALSCFGTLFAVSLYLSLKGSRAARFYLLAWGVFIVVNALGIMAAFGVLMLPFTPLMAAQLAVAFDVTLLSLALADRINAERMEKIAARSEALAAREQQMADSHRVDRLKNFLPHQVAELVVAGNDETLLAPKRREVTVCVIDLRGFTPFSELAEPEDVMAVLREFYNTMGQIVEQHGGAVEHFAGDSMLVFFNAPLEMANPQEQAVRTALEMHAAFEKLRVNWRNRGHDLGMGIGIADGFATIGAIGFAGRSQYAAIGTVTNMAARLCNIAAHGEILTTLKVLRAVEDRVHAEAKGEQQIRGFQRPVQVMRLLGLKSAAA